MNLKGLPNDTVNLIGAWIGETARVYDLSDVERALLEWSVVRVTANSVRRQMAAAEEAGAEWEITLALNHTSHVIDWLRSSVIEDAPWLHNVDELGRPKKLMKFSTLADILKEVDKAMARKNASQAKALSTSDERHVADLADGYKVVRLMTPAALDLESRRMHHCVGHGSYDRGVIDGTTEIYSVRKPNGMPVVTLEVAVDPDGDPAFIEQVQAAHNRPLDPEHVTLLKPFVFARKWAGHECGYWPRLLDAHGIPNEYTALPEGLEIDTVRMAHGVCFALRGEVVAICGIDEVPNASYDELVVSPRRYDEIVRNLPAKPAA